MGTKLIVALIVICTLGYFTIVRNKVWANNTTLWTDSSKKSPNSHRSRLNLSAYHYQNKQYVKALDEAQETIKIEPGKVTGYINAMSAALKIGAYELAYEYGGNIMSIKPLKTTAYNMSTLSDFLGKKDGQKWKQLSETLPEVTKLSLVE